MEQKKIMPCLMNIGGNFKFGDACHYSIVTTKSWSLQNSSRSLAHLAPRISSILVQPSHLKVIRLLNLRLSQSQSLKLKGKARGAVAEAAAIVASIVGLATVVGESDGVRVSSMSGSQV